jgi:hypothetical protein
MRRTYLLDGRQVTVDWGHRQHSAVYHIQVASRPAAGSVERTAPGRFMAVDTLRRPLGTFSELREALERVVRQERHEGAAPGRLAPLLGHRKESRLHDQGAGRGGVHG